MLEHFIGTACGIVIGFFLAIPVGPAGLVCIQRSISRGRMSGIISGIGSAVADGLLAVAGVFSIGFVFTFIHHHHDLLAVFGSIVLIITGYFSLKNKDTVKKVRIDTTLNAIEEFISSFILTITNPLVVFSFIASWAYISDKIGNAFITQICFIVGILVGSMLWWITLSHLAFKYSKRKEQSKIHKINRAFAWIMILFGIFLLISTIF